MQAHYVSSVKSWAARLGVYFPKERLHDQELLAAVARGNRKPMESLYLRYGPALHCIAKIMLGSETEAEDLVHDVFCEAWEKAGSYEQSRGSVGTWLLIRLRSRALDRIKSPRCRRLIPLERVHLETAQSTSQDSPSATYLTIVTRRNLAKLPVIQRRILQLLFYDDLSTSEVADELQIPLGTVKSRLSRTLGHLRGDTSTAPGTRARPAGIAASALTPEPHRGHRLPIHPTARLGGSPFREPPSLDQ